MTSKATVQNSTTEGDAVATVWKLPDSRKLLPWVLFQNYSTSARICPSKMEDVLPFSPGDSKLHVSCICLGLLKSRHQGGVRRTGDLLGHCM